MRAILEPAKDGVVVFVELKLQRLADGTILRARTEWPDGHPVNWRTMMTSVGCGDTRFLCDRAPTS